MKYLDSFLRGYVCGSVCIAGAVQVLIHASTTFCGSATWLQGTHYLTNTVDDLDREGMEGAKYMHSPAPRTKEDHASLWHHIRTGEKQYHLCIR